MQPAFRKDGTPEEPICEGCWEDTMEAESMIDPAGGDEEPQPTRE
uniref:Uncharacterized protein n=1 Tax=viral metagenome TaxID=1070528 RepID=A0A6H2A5K3_9ZZZZ